MLENTSENYLLRKI